MKCKTCEINPIFYMEKYLGIEFHIMDIDKRFGAVWRREKNKFTSKITPRLKRAQAKSDVKGELKVTPKLLRRA